MEINNPSRAKLKHVHPDLVRVVERCAKDWKHQGLGWIITQGPRTLEEQKVLFKTGATKTMRSRHLIAPNGYAHAADFAMTLNGKVRWDWPLYSKLAASMKAAAKKEGVPIEWGGDWVSFRDGPHFQLPWKQYPGTKK